MKKHLIVSTENFATAVDYVNKVKHLDSSVEWDSIKTWSDLAEAVGIDLAKVWNHGRKGLDRLAEKQSKGLDISSYAKESSEVPSNEVPVPTPTKETGERKVERKSVVQKVKVEIPMPAPTPKAGVVETRQPVPVAEAPVPKSSPKNANDVAAKIAEALAMLQVQSEEQPKAEIDEARVVEIVKGEVGRISEAIADEMAKHVQKIEVVVGEKSKPVSGLVHKEFKNILQHLAIRDNVMLVGPAGSGKTTTCEQAAEALDLAFYCKSVCAQTSKAELLGYMDAMGNYVSTEFRKAYEEGGVFVLDEVDAGNPNVIAVLNSALANSVCAFADKMVKKHEDFTLVACANTFGYGADRMYVGRNQLDAATLDRFSVIEFGYDEELETKISGNEQLAKAVQAIRKELSNERVVISPRATIQGAKLLKVGMSPEHVFNTRIAKGIPKAIADRALSVWKKFF